MGSGVRYTMDRGFNIRWIGGQNTMDRGFDIRRVGNPIYRR